MEKIKLSQSKDWQACKNLPIIDEILSINANLVLSPVTAIENIVDDIDSFLEEFADPIESES